MASRRSRQNKKNARQSSGRFSFETKLRVFAAFLSLPTLGLLLWLMIVEQLSTAAILSVLTIAGLAMLLAIAAFMDQVIRPLQTLANVVASLREEDYSFRARGAKPNDPFGDLAIEINALADLHQAQRLGALEAAALFRRVISELDAPVLAFDQHQALRLMNPAAERLFQLNPARDLGRFATHLKLDTLLLQPDEGILQIDGQPDGRQSDGQAQQARTATRWMVRRSTFRQRGEPHTLLLLSDVSAALREEERVAWRRLIRVLGHEISNSLAPIKSIAGSLRSRLPQGIADSAAGKSSIADFDRGLNVIESRAESLNRFVQAYRQLAQLPAPVLRRVTVLPLLERVISLETRLDVALDVEELLLDGVQIAADPDQMEQLLINLVRNGVEAAFSAGDDSISAGLPFESPQVAIRAEQRGETLAILIDDNGPGITNPSNLFVPFYTTKKAGSGVGLALARQIAEAHGGTLELRNRGEGRGCQAELHIPLVLKVEAVPENVPEGAPSTRA